MPHPTEPTGPAPALLRCSASWQGGKECHGASQGHLPSLECCARIHRYPCCIHGLPCPAPSLLSSHGARDQRWALQGAGKGRAARDNSAPRCQPAPAPAARPTHRQIGARCGPLSWKPGQPQAASVAPLPAPAVPCLLPAVPCGTGHPCPWGAVKVPGVTQHCHHPCARGVLGTLSLVCG